MIFSAANTNVLLSTQLVPDPNDPSPMLACILKQGETRIDAQLNTGTDTLAATVACAGSIP